MEADEKKCPQCAETIKADAKVCRYCGHNFAGPATGASKPEAPAKKGGIGKTIGIGCLGVLVLIVAIGVLAPSTPTTQETTSAAEEAMSATVATEVTAKELAAAYEQNEAAAQQSYGKRPLMVSGKIRSVDLDFSDKPFLVLEGTNMFQGPQAELDDASQAKAGSLGKGQNVKLLCGDVSEVIGTPMLKDCTIK